MWKWVLFLLILLTACSNTESNTTNQATPTDDAAISVEGAQDRVEITLESPPEWREASDVLTTSNIARASYIGRLETTGAEMSTVFRHAFSPDATRLAVLDNTNLLVWDLISGDNVFIASRRNASEVFFSSDKSEIYTVDPQGNIFIYDAESGVIINDLRGHTAFSGALSFNADEDLLVLGGTDSTVKVWDMVERTSIVTLQSSAGDVLALDISPDGMMVSMGGTNATIEIWDWRERALLSIFPANVARIDRIVFSPDSTRMAAATPEALLMFDLATFEATYALELGEGGTRDVLAFSPDGRYLITAGTTLDMLVWDVTDGARLASLPDLSGDVSAAFSPDGSLLLTVKRGGAVALWNMNSISNSSIGSAPLNVPSTRIFDLDWSPDGFVMLFFDEIGPLYVWGLPPED